MELKRPTGTRHEDTSRARPFPARSPQQRLEGIDRLYLNAYVPQLTSEAGIAAFFRRHLDHRFAPAKSAGGVGGLLMVHDHSDPEGAQTDNAAYDANGYVAALIDARTGEPSAVYGYGPFGEPLRATGTYAANPIRFSSKYTDSETGLLYYGYRYYQPTTGRWLNRDPIGEQGGVNIHAFALNRLIGEIDTLGLFGGPCWGRYKEPWGCCEHECAKEGDLWIVDAHFAMLPPQMGPEEDEEMSRTLSQLDALGSLANACSGFPKYCAYRAFMGALALEQVDLVDEAANSLYEAAKSYWRFSRGVVIHTRLVYRQCELRRCFWIGPERRRWAKSMTHPDSGWRRCTLGAWKALGVYADIAEASRFLPRCLEAHEEELRRDQDS